MKRAPVKALDRCIEEPMLVHSIEACVCEREEEREKLKCLNFTQLLKVLPGGQASFATGHPFSFQ